MPRLISSEEPERLELTAGVGRACDGEVGVVGKNDNGLCRRGTDGVVLSRCRL